MGNAIPDAGTAAEDAGAAAAEGAAEEATPSPKKSKRSRSWTPRLSLRKGGARGSKRKQSRYDMERRGSAAAKKAGPKSPEAKWKIAGGKAMYQRRMVERAEEERKNKARRDYLLAQLERRPSTRTVKLQAFARGWRVRKRLGKQREAAVKLERAWRKRQHILRQSGCRTSRIVLM